MAYPTKHLVVVATDLPVGIRPQGTPHSKVGSFFVTWYDGLNVYCSDALDTECSARTFKGNCHDFRITYRTHSGALVVIAEGGIFEPLDS